MKTFSMNTTTVPLVEQGILRLPGFTPVFSVVCLVQSKVFYTVVRVPLWFCLLVTLVSVLRFTVFDYPFGIFKLYAMICSDSVSEIN